MISKKVIMVIGGLFVTAAAAWIACAVKEKKGGKDTCDEFEEDDFKEEDVEVTEEE